MPNRLDVGGAGGVVRAELGLSPTTYTQTYATASATHANPTAVALTNANGTADGTVADVGGAFSQTTLNNNFRECSDQINALVADLANLKQVVNRIVDDLQAYGFAL